MSELFGKPHRAATGTEFELIGMPELNKLTAVFYKLSSSLARELFEYYIIVLAKTPLYSSPRKSYMKTLVQPSSVVKRSLLLQLVWCRTRR